MLGGGPQIGIEQSSYLVNEEDEVVRVCVSINQEFSGTVTANIFTLDGFAMGMLLR